MTTSSISPRPLPASRILGEATRERRHLLACIDVVVGYVTARHRASLVGWHLEAALVEDRPRFRGGETVALRATPLDGASPADLAPVPFGVLREIGSRVGDSLSGIANVVPDVASVTPDVLGLHAIVDPLDLGWRSDDAATA